MADNSTERCFSGHSIVSSHYQSRLFNFLTDRAVRWSDRAATAFRHAQLAATTAVQTVLLPLWAIAENLGWRAFPYEGLGGQRRDRANFAPGADRDQVRRLKQLERENERLKKLIADQALELAMAKDVIEGKA